MTDCSNDTMRDLLPMFAHDALSAEESTRVRAHLASCASCAKELQLLTAAQRIFAGATPAIDTAAILRSLPVPATTRPALRLERSSARRWRFPQYAIAAAASLILVATISLTSLREQIFGDGTVAVVALDSGARNATVPVDLLGAGGLSELGSEELSALLAELEQMEATISAEPVTLRQPLATVPEGI